MPRKPKVSQWQTRVIPPLPDEPVGIVKCSPARRGDIVDFKFSEKDTFPAMVQRVNSDTTCRLWIFAAMSAYAVDDVTEGPGVGSWSRRSCTLFHLEQRPSP